MDLEQKVEMLHKEAVRLEEKVKILEETVKNLQIECQRLYKQGYSDGVGAVIKDMLTEKIKEHASTSWEKWIEVNTNKFIRSNILTKEELYNQVKVTQLDPVEAEYYRQVDKAIKDDFFKQHGFKIEKGTAVIFDKSPTDEDFIKAQELIDEEEE